MFQENGIEFGSFDGKADVEKSFNYTFPSNLNLNTLLFAHVYLTKDGHHPDPSVSKYDSISTIYRRINLLDKMPKPRKMDNLIGKYEQSNDLPIATIDDQMIIYWYPEINIALVQDQSPLDVSNLTPHMARTVSLTLDRRRYLPILYMYDGWRLKNRRVVLNTDMKEVPLKISFAPMGKLKFQLLTHFGHSFQINESILGSDGEMEKLKQMFIDTNPYLLLTTLIVSVIHSIFDFLAFKNDVQFWKNRDNFQGLSVKTVLINALFQLIILMYLLEEESSWLILISVSIGVLIELWKITKVLEFKISFRGMWPTISISDRASYAKTLTQEYDNKAMKWLGLVTMPLLLGYAIYSLIYEKHRGWYSWILSTLVGFVYTFGFITMTPQLFINYKLKSVAHMPWRVFVYKALNTFIDDLFAFIIKMPTMHRLACFRDDIVFLIYLYQRWIYPVDKSRPNEYGQVYEKIVENDIQDQPLTDHDNRGSARKHPRRSNIRRRHSQNS